MTRSLVIVLGSALLAAGCATQLGGDVSTDTEVCLDKARQVSGYRMIPKRGVSKRIQRRFDERYPEFARVYRECMRSRGHESGE